jgi:hypothetical protein
MINLSGYPVALLGFQPGIAPPYYMFEKVLPLYNIFHGQLWMVRGCTYISQKRNPRTFPSQFHTLYITAWWEVCGPVKGTGLLNNGSLFWLTHLHEVILLISPWRLINFMDQSPSQEACSHSDSWIPCLLWNQKVHYHVQMCLPLVSWARYSHSIPSPPMFQRFIFIVYEGVSKSFWTCSLEQELQMVQLPATRCSCIAILWVSLVSFATITLCVAP